MNQEIYFHEDDELTDEEYFVDMKPSVMVDEPDDEYEISDDEADEPDAAPPDAFGDDELEPDDTDVAETVTPNMFRTVAKTYKPTGFTSAFLRCECNISIEDFKTVCRFSYRGKTYTGKVLHKVTKDDYIFLVDEESPKSAENAESGLKKIHIPDASFISGKPYVA